MYVIYEKNTGRVIQVCQGGGLADTLAICTEEQDAIAVDLNPTACYISDGVPVPIPPQTSKNHVFNWETKQWEDPRTLADHKLAKWEEIKAARYQEEISGLLWDGSTFDSDTLSQQRIAGAVQLAMIAQMASQPYSITWTLSNGSFRTLTAQEMVNVGVALGVHVQTIFNKGQLLQQGIEVATTVSQVEAITW